MEVAIQNLGNRRRLNRLAAVRRHAKRVAAIDVPPEHLKWLSEAATCYELPSEALEVVYLIERYSRGVIWRFAEWGTLLAVWALGRLRRSLSFDPSVGVCQVRVSSWLSASSRPKQSVEWRDFRVLMNHRGNIFACAAVLAQELGMGRSDAGSVLANDLRNRHFGFPPTFPGDCVGLGDLLEELIRLCRQRARREFA